jgi:integrase
VEAGFLPQDPGDPGGRGPLLGEVAALSDFAKAVAQDAQVGLFPQAEVGQPMMPSKSSVVRPIEGRNLHRSFTRIASDADLRVIRLHDARHGFATFMAGSGAEPRLLMELMGHAGIGVAMDVETHVVQKSNHEAIKIIDSLLRPDRSH